MEIELLNAKEISPEHLLVREYLKYLLQQSGDAPVQLHIPEMSHMIGIIPGKISAAIATLAAKKLIEVDRDQGKIILYAVTIPDSYTKSYQNRLNSIIEKRKLAELSRTSFKKFG